MLRTLVLILLLVNAAFFAWSQGWLDQVVGVRPGVQHEPQRLALQVNPERLVPVPPPPRPAQTGSLPADANQVDTEAKSSPESASDAGAASAPASAPQATICVEAGPFNTSEFPQVEAALRPLLPPNSWQSDAVTVQGLWMVYMGPYADADTMARKLNELKRLKGLNFDEVKTPASLVPGLSLGRYTSQADADAALATFKLRGIRTARIVNLRQPMDLQLVRVAQANETMQVALAGVKLPQGKGFVACRN
jgi:hypothetical protein